MSIATEITNYQTGLTNLYSQLTRIGVPLVGNKNLNNAVTTLSKTRSFDDYALVNYILNDKNTAQCINTGVIPNADTQVRVVIDAIGFWDGTQGHSYATIFGSRSSNHHVNTFVLCFTNGSTALRGEYGNTHYATGTWKTTGLNDITMNKTSLTVNGTSVNFAGGTAFSASGNLPIYLLALNEAGTLDKAWGTVKGRIRFCSIFQGGVQVRAFMPCILRKTIATSQCANSSLAHTAGTVGLWDFLTDKFYTDNSGYGFNYG